MTVIPIEQFRRRMPEQGRIRIGDKVPTASGSLRPSSIDCFRFTSRDRVAIEQIAEQYGGVVTPWTDTYAPGAAQFQVTTIVNELPVFLPPEALSGPIYELWTRGGLQRRCDGVICRVPAPADNDPALEVPCICNTEQQARACKAKTRLTVVLRNIRFGGGWRLETSSEFAARELPGMVDLIEVMQQRGLTAALLRIDQRRDIKKGKTRHYNVPVLAFEDSIQAMAQGTTATTLNLSTNQVAALEAASIEAYDIPEAEIIEWDAVPIINLAEQVVTHWNEGNPMDLITTTKLLQTLAGQLTGNSAQAFSTLDAPSADRIADLFVSILDGTSEFRGISQGKAKVKKQ